MKHLVIIGGGGFGRSVYCIAKNSKGYLVDFDIKGFLDDNMSSLDGFDGYPPLLDTIDAYRPKVDDVFVCSIGDAATKEIVCEKFAKKGVTFYTLIHKTATIYETARLGRGCIITEYTCIGADCIVGDHSLIQSYAVIGHDCKIGDYARIDTHVTCVGGTVICKGATIHTGSVINHKVTVSEHSTVGALSFVVRNVKSGTTVCGNPARRLEF